MRFSGKTDIGCVRTENQDSWRAGLREDGTGWAVVCDGMGGANAGRLAGTLAAQSMEMQLAQPGEQEPQDGGSVLRQAVLQANSAVYRAALAGGKETFGMGTTLAAVLVRGRDAFYAHVGDSRIYLLRGGTLVQLTRDHSLVQQMVEAGKITAQQARSHPQRNRITRALGVEGRVEVDVGCIPVQPGDELLLCSDGLSNAVPHGELAKTLQNIPFYRQAQHLVRLALNAGGADNITAVLVQITQEVTNG